MRRSGLSLKRSLLVSTYFALTLFAAGSIAANKETSTPSSASTSAAESSSSAAASTSTPAASTSNTSPSNTPSSSTPTSADSSSASSSIPVIQPTGSTATTSQGSLSLPPITDSTTAADSTGSVLPLPTLSKNPATVIPTYPPPSVPPTQNAPYMQQSTMPDGTVFIAVGAILGAFGVAILAWRAIVACLLHRSVERAALAQHAANDKAAFPRPPAQFYKYSDLDSSVNVAAGSVAGKGVRRTNRGPIPSSTPSQTNLFFSPTAPGAAGSHGSINNRDSRFLPSGFYAAGSASPANGHGHSISLTNLRPDSRGHPRNMGPSPPDSPAFGARGTPTSQARNVSSSTLNLNRPPSSRAPSAFLDDLLDEHPEAFPPGGPNPPHQHHFSGSGRSRH